MSEPVESELERHSKREAHIREKLTEGISMFRHGNGMYGAVSILQAIQGIFGMLRDYGDMPVWYREQRWEHRILNSLDDCLKRDWLIDAEKEGFELVAVQPLANGSFTFYIKRIAVTWASS